VGKKRGRRKRERRRKERRARSTQNFLGSFTLPVHIQPYEKLLFS
jgi:HSP20 family molecular chaperone IbpA